MGTPTRSVLIVLIVAGLVLVGAGPALKTKDIAVFFSPDGGCTEAIVNEINNAKREVLVQAYSFTSAPIAQAIAKAHERRVKVVVILDESNETAAYTGATYLMNNGVKPLIDHTHAIAHNKIIIIDRAIVITGSFNFSKAAEESNAENMLIMNRPDIAAAYVTNFDTHMKHARAYQRKESSPSRN